MNNTYAEGVFNTLRELAKSQQPNSPEFILQAFCSTWSPRHLGLLPEFRITEFAGDLPAWQVGYRDVDNNPQTIWVIEKEGLYVTTTVSLRSILDLEEVEVLPWSTLLWSEVAEALPKLDDSLWVESSQEAVSLLKEFTSLYYQSV
jgi:hypothetical protein